MITEQVRAHFLASPIEDVQFVLRNRIVFVTGADVLKDDGVYSAFFIGYTAAGRYGLSVSSPLMITFMFSYVMSKYINKVRVTSEPSTTLYKNGVVSVGGMTEDSQLYDDPILEPIDDFERVSIGEPFTLLSFDGDSYSATWFGHTM
jgi:hypothetical protein